MRVSSKIRIVRCVGATALFVVMGLLLQPQASWAKTLLAGVFLLVALALLAE